MSTARGATLLGPERLEIREYPVPEVADDGALLRIGLGGVCGTDVKYFHGRIDMPYPVILGHEIFGRVERLGRAAARIHGVAEGDRVILKGSRGCGHCRDCRDGAPRFCPQRTLYGSATTAADPPHLFGGLADYLYVNPDAELFKVGDGMSDEAAVLCGSVMANGYQWAILHGGVTFGDTVLIQGPGQQGLACTWAARAAGAARIIVTGTAADADRLALARQWGADLTVEADTTDIMEVVAGETGGAMADVVVDVSGSPAALEPSIAALRKRGTLVLAGLSGGQQVPVGIDALVWKEIKVQGAFTAGSPALTATMELIESTGFKPEEMISHSFSLDDTELCIRAIGNEIDGMYPTKAVIRP